MKPFTSDIVIGLEIHANTNSRTKLFCGCPNAPSSIPNTQTCPTCLGMPGSKPVLNKRCMEQAVQLCLALGCTVAKQLVFSRKSYFYPDLAKNYQITQYELPLGQKGKLALSSGREIGIIRIHLEEDPASLLHPGSIASAPYVLIDYNRSGTPLLEIVTEPALASPEEAREFMNALITVLQYLEIFDVDTCIIKADANISVRASGYVRVEVKNITGFREIERALFYEVDRQKHELSEGRQITAETRGWDAEKGVSYSLRTKESEDDYGYIIDPDLVPVGISPQWIARLRAALPELAQEKTKRFIREHRISPVDAGVLAQEKLLAGLFEKVAAKISPQLAAKWLRRELVRVLNYSGKTMKELQIDESHLIDLLTLVEKKRITEATAQRIMERLMEGPFDVKEHVRQQGLEAVADAGQLDALCREAIRENQKAVDDYRNGEEKALHFLMGVVMKKSKGRASPKEVTEILKRLVQ